VLRSLISVDIPLNNGCLVPIKIVLPPGTILSPSEDAATVGGNVDTSQRATDTILKAFEVCGASQGTCNNLTYGYGGDAKDGKARSGFGYYETIAGGAGAGPTWQGQDCVHVHMTNVSDPSWRSPVSHFLSIRLQLAMSKSSSGSTP
jgi:5-oxoprolinase (ATP-hydrolysing)